MSQQNRSDRRSGRRAWVVATACLSLVATGCKSGASVSKPSWWSFGGGGGDPAKLASAPPFGDAQAGGGVAKPSSMASPYPTTTTPEGYSIDGSRPASAAATQVASAPAAQYPSTDNAAPITYGQAAPAYPATSAEPPAAAPVAMGPQTGPYATLPQTVPAGQQAIESPAGVGPATGLAAGLPAAAPAARIADTRPASSFDRGLQATDPRSGDPRYGDVNASRFSGSGFAGSGPAAAPAGFPNASLPAGPIEPPMEPARDTALPAYAPPAAAAPASALPSSATPPPPRRRPDPGYRPGGTSSYRPNSAILVGEPVADPAVRAAGFQMPADSIQR